MSLSVCVAGMVAMEALIHAGVLAHPWWRVLAMAFEAGTVGGMADWFAVSAMFRPVPIPLLSRHTDIIARNRGRIVENLKDYVQNKLLTPEVIRDKLAGVRFWVLGLHYLDSADSRQRLAQILRTLLGNFAAQLDREEVVTLLATAARERFLAFDLARPLGGWMRHALERGDHTGLWQEIIDEAGRYIGSEPVRMRIAAIIKEAAAKEKAGGLAKRLWLSTGEWAGGLNYESWADEVAKAIADWLDKVKADPDHRFRKAADGYLLDYATALEAGRADAVASIERFARGVMEKADLQPLIATAIADLKALVGRELGDETSKLSLAIAALIDGFIGRLRTDPKLQEFVDQQVRESICLLITENHGLIGDMVGASLSPEKLSDRELVAQIEDRVGSDLQYIRLNGAIVGGMIGAIIMIAKLVFLGG